MLTNAALGQIHFHVVFSTKYLEKESFFFVCNARLLIPLVSNGSRIVDPLLLSSLFDRERSKAGLVDRKMEGPCLHFPVLQTGLSFFFG